MSGQFSYDGWGQPSTTLGCQHTWLTCAPVVTWATDINTDTSHAPTPVAAESGTQTCLWQQLGSILHHGNSATPVVGQATQISKAMGASWTLDTNMASGVICMAFHDNRSHRHQQRPQMQHGHRPRNQLRPRCHQAGNQQECFLIDKKHVFFILRHSPYIV